MKEGLIQLNLSKPEKESLLKGGKIEETKLSVGVANSNDWEEFKWIRIEAKLNSPENIGGNLEDDLDRSDEQWRESLSSNKEFVVLSRYDSHAIGLARGRKRDDGLWAIQNVYLNKEFRKSESGSNIAERLVQEVLDEIKRRGGKRVLLWVRKKNLSAISLYSKLGFQDIKSPARILKIIGGQLYLTINWQIMEKDLD